MEAILLYFAKASLLIIVYFLAYHFLLRKETFFTSNRWFLLLGLATSATLPLFFIKKFIVVPQPEFTPEQLVALSNIPLTTVAQEASINWFLIAVSIYALIVGILFFKIIGNIFSLFKLLHKKEIIRRDQFALVDINEDITPFSFFNFIVFNSNYYTNDELQSILLHEKVHSQERHSIDVLLARLFCIVFWFNPFMWLYKKAMIQNLEYIADSKASKQFEDKKVYQKALLKVVTHQNCLAITNHFYQSLIKNRIVMLNKNQSQKRNSWKYALVLPALAIFMLLFQVKTIAQEKRHNSKVAELVWNKNATEEEFKDDADRLKEFGVTLKFSKVKRNSNGEITGIKIEFKDANGKKGMTHIQGDEPIKPIYFHKAKDKIGFGVRPNDSRIAQGKHINDTNDEKDFGFSFLGDDEDAVADIEKIVIPNLPEIADAPEVEGIHPPDAPKAPKMKSFNKSIIINKKNDAKPEIIINGKKLDADSEEYKKMAEDFDGRLEFKMDENGPMVFKFNDDQVFKFNPGDVEKVTREAIEKSRIQIEKMRERMEKMHPEMEKMKIEMEKVKPEDFNFDFRWDDKENSDADMKKAREEMMKAKEEMLKARDEMMKAREEMMRAKSESKTKKA
ncbi:M56 family metallopeptidase [Flavobacterium sp. H122]|uniref:M56 family metallopeptidase n=1 Tax=Flavobacterium sp. H122 TaxID=2529860 RepID=UPI0010AADDFF|nr:M56 family metallopeptidase [Flavobacterium sp. H122]